MENKYKLIKGNNIDVMKKMETNSVDLIFADPPYNMQTSGVLKRFEGTNFKGVDDKWDKFNSLDEYTKYSYEWLLESKRLLKKDGSLWVIGSFHNIHILGTILLDLGYWIQGEIIWNKPNPVPNFAGTRFTNAHEILIWATPNKNSKKTFNYKTMKYLNGGKQMKSVWDIGICQGNERLKDENGNKIHNTQKPLELLERIILSTTKYGDIVLDPFSGTGTTGEASLKYGRQYIGIDQDLDNKYLKASENRLSKIIISNQDDLVFNKYDIKEKRIPIETLIKEKYIGDIITTPTGNQYKLLKNGKVKINDEYYSIHLGAAKLLNKTNHNGWHYWLYNNQTLDTYRIKYRKENE